MAPLSRGTDKPKHKRKRKTRTEVRSPTPASSESSDTVSGPNNTDILEESKPKKKRKADANGTTAVNGDASPPPKPSDERPTSEQIDSEFADFYLRTVTRELGEDLDKIRSAKDFTDASLPLLVQALQQGAAVFSEPEKRRVLGVS